MKRLLLVPLAAALLAGGCAKQKQPGDPLSMKKAQASFETGDYERSVQFSTDALNNGAAPADAHLLRAKAYERMGEAKWAIADYEASRKANPSSVEAGVRQARLHQSLGESEKADTLLDVINGPMAETYTNRDRFLGLAVHGEVAMTQGNFTRALELFINALSVVRNSSNLSGEPMVAVVNYNMSRIYFERADYKHARSFYQRYLDVSRSEETGNTAARETIAKMPEEKRPAAEAVLNGEALSVRALYEKTHGKEEKK
jgi:tetratricopeptide (TPR) repeat protein